MLSKKFFKTKDEAEMTFEFCRDDVKTVELFGEFTDWQPVEMKYNAKAKSFKAKVRLPKDKDFSFRYLLDGSEWENDYAADAYIPNEFGTEDSVVTTTQH